MVVEPHHPREATVTVCASDSLSPYADFRCDGVDDQVEIQAAIDVLDASGGVVLLTEGTFNTSAPLTLPTARGKAVTLKGFDRLRTIINYSGADYAIKCEAAAVTIFHTLSNFRIVAVNGGGIRFYRCVDVAHTIISDMYFGNLAGEAAGIGGDAINVEECHSIAIKDVAIYKANRGIVVNYCNAVNITNTSIDGCASDGVVILATNVLYFRGISEANGGYGIKLGDAGTTTNAGFHIRIASSYFEGDKDAEVRLDYGARDVVIENCSFGTTGAGTDIGIDIDKGENVTILTSHFFSTTGTGIKISNTSSRVTIVEPTYSMPTGLDDSATDTKVIDASGFDGVDIAAHAANFGFHNKIVRKTSDETVNNLDTPQDDDELYFAVGANEVWLIYVIFLYNSSAVADFLGKFAIPAGASLLWGYNNSQDSSSTQVNGAPLDGHGTDAIAILHALIINGATAGNFQVKWAQGTAEVSDTKVLTNSCIIAHQLA